MLFKTKITILPEPEMKDSGVVLLETLLRWDDTEEQIGFLGQVGRGSQEPAIAQLSLLDIETGVALHKELGILSNFLKNTIYFIIILKKAYFEKTHMRSKPFDVTVWTARKHQRFIGSREHGILEERTTGYAAIQDCLVVLDFRIGSQVGALFSQLEMYFALKNNLQKIEKKKYPESSLYVQILYYFKET